MTAQGSDLFENNHPRVDLGDDRLYGLIRGEPSADRSWSGVLGEVFDFPTPPSPRGGYNTACYRGYIASFVLNPDGTLTLVHYEYLTHKPAVVDGKDSVHLDIERDSVGKTISGDFWMVMRPHFYSDPTTFVPFRDGHVVEDQSEWKIFP